MVPKIFIVLLIVMLSSLKALSIAAPGSLFVYIVQTQHSSQFRWHVLGRSNEQTSDVEGIVEAAVIGGTQVGFATRAGGVSILDLRDGRQTHLQIKLNQGPFLFHDEY